MPGQHYLLIYELAANYLERRGEFRHEHLTLAWNAADQGDLLLGGAVAEPVDQAFLLFRGTSPDVAKRFAESDPYVRNGIVKRWQVKQWNTVVGIDSASPIRPKSDGASR